MKFPVVRDRSGNVSKVETGTMYWMAGTVLLAAVVLAATVIWMLAGGIVHFG